MNVDVEVCYVMFWLDCNWVSEFVLFGGIGITAVTHTTVIAAIIILLWPIYLQLPLVLHW